MDLWDWKKRKKNGQANGQAEAGAAWARGAAAGAM